MDRADGWATGARRFAAPVRVALRRIAARPAAPLLTALGVAVGAAALAVLLVSNVILEDRAVADAIARLPLNQRVVSVSWVGATGGDFPTLDRQARAGLASVGLDKPVRAVAFRTTTLGGNLVRLAAFDRLHNVLELRSGRFPSRCSPRRCETVALDAPPAGGTSGVVVVGSARRKDGVPIERFTGSPARAAPTLVANGVEALARRREVGGLFRSLTWAVTLRTDELSAADVASLPRRIAELDTALRARSGGFAVEAPLDDLRAAAERAKRATRRQFVVTAGCTAILLAFVVLAAARARRGAHATVYRLRRLRGRRWQVGLEQAAYAGAIAASGALVGWLVGIGAGAVIAAAMDRPVGNVVRRSALGAEGLAGFAFVVVVAVIALVATTRARTLEIRGRRITALDVAAAGLLAVIATGVATQGAGGSNVGDGDGGPILLALPALVALAGGVLSARLSPPLLRLLERLIPSGWTWLRLAFLSLVRSGGTAGVTIACLTVTAALAVFALSYGATLARNQKDAAAFAVPLDYVVARDEARAVAFGTRTNLSRSYAGKQAFGVVRVSGEAPSLNRRGRLNILGLPAAAIEDLRWRDDYSDRAPGALARSIAYAGEELRGVPIPADARELVLPLTVDGDPLRITASIQRRDRGFAVLDLGASSRSPERRAKLPPSARGGKLVALTLGFPPGEEFTAAHRATGTRPAPDVFVQGTLHLGPPRVRTDAGSRKLAVDYREWVRSDGSGGGASASRVGLRYVLTQEQAFRIRPRQPTDGRPVAVIASRSIALAAGNATVLPVRVGPAEVEVRITATADRFPTLADDFLIADSVALETAANAASPGAVVVDEVWLHGEPGAERLLHRVAPIPVEIASRRRIQERLQADPVSRSVSIALLLTALVAGALAILGILLTLSVDARDEQAELFDLEALGIEPSGLARHLWVRLALLIAVGLTGGLATGIAAVLLVTDVVAVTANVVVAEPPLVAVVNWLVLSLGLAAFSMLALGAAGILARAQFRAAAPDRPGPA